MKKKITFILVVLLTIVFSIFNVSCEKNKTNENQQSSFQSQNVAQTAEEQKSVEEKEVVLSVYNTSLKKIVKMPLEECCLGTFTHQLLICIGFSPSQGKVKEEEVKTGGGEFSTASLALQTTTENPLGVKQSLALSIAHLHPWIASFGSQSSPRWEAAF